MKKSCKWLISFVLMLPACYLFNEAPPLPDKLLPVNQSWIDEKIQKMSLDQKIGQLIVVCTDSAVQSDADPWYLKIKDYIRRYYIGGLLIKRGETYQTLAYINHMQTFSITPLLIASSFGNGVGGSINGGTAFIPPGGMAATGESNNTRDAGAITAREARALGFHLTLSPCAAIAAPESDFKTYGLDPGRVSDYCAANIKGIQENGLLACATYFPAIDSSPAENQIGKNMISMTDWQETGLPLFSKSIRAGVAFVMPSNCAFPVMDQGFERPASLSPYLLTDILRNRLKFEGVIISDVLTDPVVKEIYYPGYTAVKAVKAGVDLLVMEDNIQTVFAAIRQAVQDQGITIERINASVKRILYWKSILGLPDNSTADTEFARSRLRTPASLRTADRIAAEALTVLNNQDLPLPFPKNKKVFTISFTSGFSDLSPQTEFLTRFRLIYPSTRSATVTPDLSEGKKDSVLYDAAASDVIIHLYFFNKDRRLSDDQNFLIGKIDSLGKTNIHIIFGFPHLDKKLPRLKNLLLVYSDIPGCQRAAADALVGQLAVQGKLSVNLPGLSASGSAEIIRKQTMELQPVSHLSSLPNPSYLDSLKNYLRLSIADSAFPGCAIAVGYRNHLIMNEGFGRFTYDIQAAQDQSNSIFDLASVTKVVATTTMAMILYDQGRLNLDWRVQDIIPEFQGENKNQITIRNLLTHTSGLPGWEKFYLTLRGKERIVQEICRTELIYQPGTKSVYSDLGMILMQKILETIAQKPLNLLFEAYIALPLGMTRTFYNPDPKYYNEIVPTEISEFHKKLVRGFVHDENTFAMGGVSGHAGLFSTAEDLAAFSQMYLNGGIYKFKRILQPETIRLFTSRQNLVQGSTRAIGWDTRSEQHSMSGSYMSMQAFGHSGFTGTTIWIDPASDVFVVFLTNRVYPTRENLKIRRVRPKVHDYIMKAILDPGSYQP